MLMLVLMLFTFWRLHIKHTISEHELFAHLLFDLCLLTVIFIYSGGPSNPFVSFYLFPIVVSASTLRSHFTWALLLLGLVMYSSLFLFDPIAPSADQHNHHSAPIFSLHLYGMWINFAFSALLIGTFVVKMRTAIFRQQALINQQREATLRDERVIAIATQAANITHSLGTPLSTMDIIINDLKHDATHEDIRGDITTLSNQIDFCKKELQALRKTTSKEWQDLRQQTAIQDLMKDLNAEMQLLYGESPLDIQITPDLENMPIMVDFNLRLALINLLDNACVASPQRVDVLVSKNSSNQLQIAIRDYGQGIPAELEGEPKTPTTSTKKNGLGLGLFLSHATLERRGGHLSLNNSKTGDGTISQILLPLEDQY